MAETAQTMTEFTYAPGEKNIVGDRFQSERDHLLAQNLHRRIQHARAVQGAEHPVRADPRSARPPRPPLRNIASVDT